MSAEKGDQNLKSADAKFNSVDGRFIFAFSSESLRPGVEKNNIPFQSPKNTSTFTRIHLEDMNLQLMREFEEFEGLGAQVVDDATITMENEDDDPSFRPAQASLLTSNDIYYEVWCILALKSINKGKITTEYVYSWTKEV